MTTKTSPQRSLVIAVVTAATAAVDWATKAIASAALDTRSIDVGGVLTLRLSHNPGVAFGLGDRLPGAVVIAVTATVTVVLALVALRGLLPSRVAAGLLLGGAVANLGDRVLGGTVVDFLDLGWWPSFNLADVTLSGGCLLMLLLALRGPDTRDSPRAHSVGDHEHLGDLVGGDNGREPKDTQAR